MRQGKPGSVKVVVRCVPLPLPPGPWLGEPWACSLSAWRLFSVCSSPFHRVWGQPLIREPYNVFLAYTSLSRLCGL